MKLNKLTEIFLYLLEQGIDEQCVSCNQAGIGFLYKNKSISVFVQDDSLEHIVIWLTRDCFLIANPKTNWRWSQSGPESQHEETKEFVNNLIEIFK